MVKGMVTQDTTYELAACFGSRRHSNACVSACGYEVFNNTLPEARCQEKIFGAQTAPAKDNSPFQLMLLMSADAADASTLPGEAGGGKGLRLHCTNEPRQRHSSVAAVNIYMAKGLGR